ncbi:MAG TPA: IPT/TIG domain-containing protein [Vulgatibacter sp.]|nr:IPT/TIG domain-containing protein [Vulgatibacter sp.]
MGQLLDTSTRRSARRRHAAGLPGAPAPRRSRTAPSRLRHAAAAALGLLLASLAACALPDPGAVPGEPGGKPRHREPATGGSGGDGGAGGFGGAGGSGGAGGAITPVRLDAVRPPMGSREGGDTVTLQGAGFLQNFGKQASANTQVRFGSNPAIGVRVIDDETIYVGVPPGLAGWTDVTVSNPRGEAACEGCFRYLEPVSIASIDPPYGSADGGTLVTLRGTGLGEGMILTFGANAALDLQLQEDGSLTAIAPPGEEGALVDVRIFDEGGAATLRKSFRYVAPLRIDSVSPPGGPLAGGNAAAIAGAGLTADAEVLVGGTPAHASLRADGRLEVTMPPRSTAGAVPLEVRTRAGDAVGTYAYFDPDETELRLHVIDPASRLWTAPPGGSYTLIGNRLDDPHLAVRIGGELAEIHGPRSPWSVTVSAPQGAGPGVVDVEARVEGEVAILEGAFRYHDLPLQVLSFSPQSAPVEGGGAISIEVSGVLGTPRVFVGAREATGVVRMSATRVTAIIPPGAVGTVPVRVVDAEDPAVEGRRDGFSYRSPLRISRVEPASGARAGGTLVTVRGVGLDTPSLVLAFGGNEVRPQSVLDPFTAVVKTPRGDVGLVDVEAGAQASGEPWPSFTLRDGYSYFNPSSTTGGSSGGPLNGNLNVSVVDGTWWKFGAPIPNARVMAGSGDGMVAGYTDARGEVTLSSPLLVKPQVVTVVRSGFEAATVVNHRSENLTVRLLDLDPGPPPDPVPGPPPPEPGAVEGRVWGFKLPPNRPLRTGEREVAWVGVAARSVFSLPPFGPPPSFIEIAAEGDPFRFVFVGGRQLALYAIYGVENTITREFEPLTLGVSRGVLTEPGVVTEADVILDTHLDVTVPVTILNPPEADGLSTSSRVYAYADLGGDGIVPLDSAITRSGDRSKATLTRLPALVGVNLLFAVRGGQGLQQDEPFTATFRRQLGDVRQGVAIGPLLGLTRFVSPDMGLGPYIEWSRSPGPTPALSYLYIDTVTGMPLWHAVVPGDTTRFEVPPALHGELRNHTQLRLTLVQGIEPRSSFDQWSYDLLTTSAFTSYTVDSVLFSL